MITQIVVCGIMEQGMIIAKQGAQVHVVVHGNIMMMGGVKTVWSPYHVV